jgi:hypothetical protein
MRGTIVSRFARAGHDAEQVVALEVADVDAALAFYRRVMASDDGGRHGTQMAFSNLGIGRPP